jgi:hypothetical protein
MHHERADQIWSIHTRRGIMICLTEADIGRKVVCITPGMNMIEGRIKYYDDDLVYVRFEGKDHDTACEYHEISLV